MIGQTSIDLLYHYSLLRLISGKRGNLETASFTMVTNVALLNVTSSLYLWTDEHETTAWSAAWNSRPDVQHVTATQVPCSLRSHSTSTVQLRRTLPFFQLFISQLIRKILFNVSSDLTGSQRSLLLEIRNYTRSSAVAEIPRDALWRVKSGLGGF